MVDIRTLLPELRELVRKLAEDLLARVSADSDAKLLKAYHQIKEGGAHRPELRGVAGRLPRSGRRGLGAGLCLLAVHGGQRPHRRVLAGR